MGTCMEAGALAWTWYNYYVGLNVERGGSGAVHQVKWCPCADLAGVWRFSRPGFSGVRHRAVGEVWQWWASTSRGQLLCLFTSPDLSVDT